MSTIPSPLPPLAHNMKWHCIVCGATGAFTLVSLRPWTRVQRLDSLITVTLSEHSAHGLLSLFWDFPPSWAAEVFPDE